MPILEADAHKREAIKNNTSLGPLQKMEQFKAIHAKSDPPIRAILNPQQYEQLQQICQQKIRAAMEKKMGQQQGVTHASPSFSADHRCPLPYSPGLDQAIGYIWVGLDELLHDVG